MHVRRGRRKGGRKARFEAQVSAAQIFMDGSDGLEILRGLVGCLVLGDAMGSGVHVAAVKVRYSTVHSVC